MLYVGTAIAVFTLLYKILKGLANKGMNATGYVDGITDYYYYILFSYDVSDLNEMVGLIYSAILTRHMIYILQ